MREKKKKIKTKKKKNPTNKQKINNSSNITSIRQPSVINIKIPTNCCSLEMSSGPACFGARDLCFLLYCGYSASGM